MRSVLYRHAQYGFVQALLRSPQVRLCERRVREKAMEYLEECGSGRANDIASHLPYGLQRKLELARALALEPVLCYWMNLPRDEP